MVVMAGLFMLAKSKKEQLGRMYTIASSVAVAFGTLIFVFGITAGILMCCHKACGKGENNCKSEMQCPMMMHGGGMGNCSKMNMHGNCEMGGGSCSDMGNSKCGGGMSEECEKMCEKEGNMVKEVIIKKLGEGENGAEVKVEVEKSTK